MNLRHCEICPHRCGVDRTAGEKGVCGVTGETVLLGRAALHFWEEPYLSGTRGSGTVFFGGCSLQCCFCQNYELSRGRVGTAVSIERLAEIFCGLQDQGAHNINLVTPTHYAWHLARAIPLAKQKGLHIPVVYNSGGYERTETLQALEGLVDIYLPDVKFPDTEGAKRYCAAPDYPETVWNALDEMVRQVGAPVFDGNGILHRGVAVRHLVLPERTAQSMQVLDTLHERYGEGILISLMSQYTPMPQCTLEELQKPVPPVQYARLVRYAQSIGITNALVQEGSAVGESFIPSFGEIEFP